MALHIIQTSSVIRWTALSGIVLGLGVAGGCKAQSQARTAGESARTVPRQQSNPSAIQRAVMDFADRFVSAVTDTFDKVAATSPKYALAAKEDKIDACVGALGNAVNTLPLVGLMDMAIFVRLTRQSMEDAWAVETYGAEGAGLLLAAMSKQEEDIWEVAGTYLSTEQIKELGELAAQWREKHPNQRYLAGVRLATFPEADSKNWPGRRLANSVFGLVRLDPFAGLDPAVRQVEETRVLAERMFFYLRHVPDLVSWQADVLYMQMMGAPQIASFLDNTAEFSGATRKFSDASAELARTVETFRAELPKQRSEAIKQLDEAVARQREEAVKQVAGEVAAQRDAAVKQVAREVDAVRDAALKQAGQEIAVQRQAAIDQLNSTVTAQQTTLAENLQRVSDSTIDRVYQRARSLVTLALGGTAGVIVVGLLVAAGLRRRGGGERESR